MKICLEISFKPKLLRMHGYENLIATLERCLCTPLCFIHKLLAGVLIELDMLFYAFVMYYALKICLYSFSLHDPLLCSNFCKTLFPKIMLSVWRF